MQVKTNLCRPNPSMYVSQFIYISDNTLYLDRKFIYQVNYKIVLRVDVIIVVIFILIGCINRRIRCGIGSYIVPPIVLGMISQSRMWHQYINCQNGEKVKLDQIARK